MNTRRLTTFQFPDADPFFIGLDSIMNKFNNTSTGNYPPYNIIKSSENKYLVEMAVAGFNEDSLDITVKNGVLTVSGKVGSQESKNYIHKGIAAREFIRTFTLADTVEVHGASLQNGMLIIELENILPDAKKEKKIGITSYKSNPELLVE